MSIPAVNYRETSFEKPDLTLIIGKPDFETLYQLIIDLRTNALSVHSNLGGGNHGHLGLLMTPVQYALEAQVAYIRPDHPGTLTIPAATARHLADQMEHEYKENVRIFHEVRGVEKALTQQVVSAVEGKCLLSLRVTKPDNSMGISSKSSNTSRKLTDKFLPPSSVLLKKKLSK